MKFEFEINGVSMELKGDEKKVLFTGIFEHALNSAVLAARFGQETTAVVNRVPAQENKEKVEDLDCNENESNEEN